MILISIAQTVSIPFKITSVDIFSWQENEIEIKNEMKSAIAAVAADTVWPVSNHVE